MSAFFESMGYPLLACLILTGIHVYLGIHVISRKVIFVDLALAQVAALGSVWGVLLGWDLANDPWTVKAFSLAFTFIGAAVFSLTRMRSERVPHEALIGITYAVALGATILASAHLAHGAEEVSELLAGSILWVRGETIVATTILYAAIGTFHYLFRRQFFLISLRPDEAAAQGLNVRLWDFLFYVSFGFVVTSSVSIAGVLLVFSYLVIPAVIAMLFVDGIRARLTLGWIVGTVVSAVGCTFSYFRDLPSGPTIVACFGCALVLAGLGHYLATSESRARAALRVAAGTALFAALLGGSFLLQKHERHDLAHVLRDGNKAERMLALAEVEADPSQWSKIKPLVRSVLHGKETEVRVKLLELVCKRREVEFLADVQALLSDADDVVQEKAVRCVREWGGPDSANALFAAASRESDEYMKVEMAEALLELHDIRGAPLLIDVIATGEAVQARRDAWEHLSAHVPIDIPVRTDLPPNENVQGIAALRRWWEEHRAALKLDHGDVFKLER
jgi:zinc/manganese transport system permease protein